MSGALKSLAAVIVATAILYGLQKTTPGYGEITAPRPVDGALGQPVQGDIFAVTLEKAIVARTITVQGISGGRDFTTAGVWVLVEGTAEARKESLSLLSAEWLARDGVRYTLTQRLSSVPGMLPGQRLEPGLPTPVLMVFELPANAVAGGTLLIARSAWKSLEEQARISMSTMPTEVRSSVSIVRSQGPTPWSVSVQ